MKKKALSQRQLEVMEILWSCESGMTASAIVKAAPDLQINTVQAALRSLLSKNYIKVGDIVYSGTVLSRSYVPIVNKEEYLQFTCRELSKISSSSLVLANLINEEDDADRLEALEEMIRCRREKLSEDQ